MAYSSSFERIGGSPDQPDYLYYNATIVNNNASDLAAGLVVYDPNVQFNESRDTAIIDDCSDYYFSIIRFAMDGPNLDLPLFIPDIQIGTGQTNVNLTSYAIAISYKQTWYDIDGNPQEFEINPAPTFVFYKPETKNPVLAPVPRSPGSPNYVGLWTPLGSYNVGDIVSLVIDTNGSGNAPYYECILANTGRRPPNETYWKYASPVLGSGQDLTSRYYWVYTYQHWLDLVNQTIYDPALVNSAPNTIANCCYSNLLNLFYQQWLIQCPTSPFPYATLGDFAKTIVPPVFTRDNNSNLFSITADSDAFGKRIQTFTVGGINPTPFTAPVCDIWFNSNMYGLFANFPNSYINDPALYPVGYVNRIEFPDKFYKNVVDYRLPPYGGVPPLGLVPLYEQKPYYVLEQEYLSTDSLWSPIGSIVFTSTLMPVMNEQTGPPIELGTSNTNFSAPTVRSAFDPIITDIVVPLSDKGAHDYRSFIYYNPTAEYRLADFTTHTSIRQIDIQVFWRSRLTNELYPIQMFNQSSVSIKVMFKKIGAGSPTKGAPPHSSGHR